MKMTLKLDELFFNIPAACEEDDVLAVLECANGLRDVADLYPCLVYDDTRIEPNRWDISRQRGSWFRLLQARKTA